MKIELITGVLLAGGKSRRMGTDKSRILLDGQTLFDRSFLALERIFSQNLVVVATDDQVFEARGSKIVTDLIPNCATAGGLYTGLSYADQDLVFVVACDMPFLDERVIRHMALKAEGFDLTVAKLLQGIQPLHGFYRKTCLPVLEEMIRKKDLKLQHLLEAPVLKTHVLTEEEFKGIESSLLSFMNLNTPGDLEMATKILQV